VTPCGEEDAVGANFGGGDFGGDGAPERVPTAYALAYVREDRAEEVLRPPEGADRAEKRQKEASAPHPRASRFARAAARDSSQLLPREQECQQKRKGARVADL